MTTVRGVGPVGNLTHLLEHFLLGGGDRDRKSYCFRNNQPDILVPDYSIASLQWEMRGHTRSSLGHRKFFGLVVDLTEICLEPSQSGAVSYCAGRFSFSAAMWCLWTPSPSPSMPSAVWTAFLLHKAWNCIQPLRSSCS